MRDCTDEHVSTFSGEEPAVKRLSSADFDSRANSITDWLHVADDLHATQALLCGHSFHLSSAWPDGKFPSYTEFRIAPVALMLRGMALECLLKALYLKHCGRLAANGRYSGILKGNDHNLPAIAQKIDKAAPLNLSSKQRHFLERLARNITRGRYPVDKTIAEFIRPAATAGRRPKTPDLLLRHEYDDDSRLYESLFSVLRGQLRDDVRKLYGENEI
jgi:hypothetical protein